jgi:hypothetical protein
VALDKDAEAARPWIEVAKPTHPSLIDAKHLVADLYNMVNVPTILWIDEDGKIVRPNDVAYGDNTWQEVTGFDADAHKKALRAWVKGEAPPAYSDTRIKELQNLPDEAHQEARAEFALAQYLWTQNKFDAADKHFARAGELAPQDFTIRRGSFPMRDKDPMGEEFFEMTKEWTEAGNEYYLPLPEK